MILCGFVLNHKSYAQPRVSIPIQSQTDAASGISPFFTIQPPRGSTLLLGRGYNSVSATVGGPCIEVDSLETLKGDPSSSTGQKVVYSMQEIQDLSQMREILEVNASGALGLGSYSADLKAKYLNENSFNSTNLFLVIKVSVENQTEVLKNFKLTPAAYSLLQKSKEAFLKGCGNQFIAARVTGGEFIAVIEVETNSLEEKKEILAKMSGEGLFWKVNPDFSSHLSYIMKRHRASVRVFRTGDQGELPELKAENLVSYAINFPGKVLRQSSQSWPFLVSTESYDSVLDKPSEDWISLSDQQRVLDQLSLYQSKAKLDLNNIDHVLSNSSQYQRVEHTTLNKTKDLYLEIISQVRLSAQSCATQPLFDCKSPMIRWPNLKLPEPKPVTVSDDDEMDSPEMPYSFETP